MNSDSTGRRRVEYQPGLTSAGPTTSLCTSYVVGVGGMRDELLSSQRACLCSLALCGGRSSLGFNGE